MTPRIHRLLQLFSGTLTSVTESETQATLNGSWKCNVGLLKPPAAGDLKAALAAFPKRDRTSLSMVIAGGESTVFLSGEPDQVEDQLAMFQTRLGVADPNDECLFTVTIVKSIDEGKVTVYSTPLFLTHLEGRSISERLGIFNEFLNKTGSVKIFCDDPITRFGSSTILFLNEDADDKSVDKLNRQSVLTMRDDVAHFVDGAKYELLPDDFSLIESAPDVRWSQLFAQLTNVLVLAFTADYTAFTAPNRLTFKLSGYKPINETLNPEDLVGADWGAAFKIYEWTYQSGSVSDKVGLLRNILSLHFDNGKPRYNVDVYNSVRSGFQMYLKKNVEQYIEVKTKLSDYLQNFGQEAFGNLDKYTGALKETFGALLTFFISTMILSAIGGKGLSGIFTTDITYLTYAFLVCSFLYLLLSLYFLHRKRKSLEGDYASFKNRYVDLLNPDDLNRIFEADKPLTQISKEIKSQSKLISVAWILIILILGTVAFTLHRKQAQVSSTTTQETKSEASSPASNSPR